jgi:hypothetical protein
VNVLLVCQFYRKVAPPQSRARTVAGQLLGNIFALFIPRSRSRSRSRNRNNAFIKCCEALSEF